jgi:hypothetical protein
MVLAGSGRSGSGARIVKASGAVIVESQNVLASGERDALVKLVRWRVRCQLVI